MDKQVLRYRRRNIVLTGSVLLLAGVLLYVLARMGRGIPCVFHLLTNWNCPGCGNTNFVLCVLRGDFLEGIRSNYLAVVEFAYLVWVYVSAIKAYYATGKVIYVPKYPALDIALLCVLVLWTVVRNLLGI